MSKYIDRFLKYKSAPDMLGFKIFPRSGLPKEIEEAMGMWEFINRCWKGLETEDINRFIVVGDGCSPRLGGLLAFLTKNQVISIDPALRDDEKWKEIQRLTLIPERAEDVDIKIQDGDVILFPHSHTNIRRVLQTWDYKGKKFKVVSMPCCNYKQQVIPNKVGFAYIDKDIRSERNTIYGWEFT